MGQKQPEEPHEHSLTRESKPTTTGSTGRALPGTEKVLSNLLQYSTKLYQINSFSENRLGIWGSYCVCHGVKDRTGWGKAEHFPISTYPQYGRFAIGNWSNQPLTIVSEEQWLHLHCPVAVSNMSQRLWDTEPPSQYMWWSEPQLCPAFAIVTFQRQLNDASLLTTTPEVLYQLKSLFLMRATKSGKVGAVLYRLWASPAFLEDCEHQWQKCVRAPF